MKHIYPAALLAAFLIVGSAALLHSAGALPSGDYAFAQIPLGPFTP